MKIDLSRFCETFFEEAAEHLVTMEAALLRLEVAPEDAELLNEVFRAAHSMKGGSGTLGLSDLSELTHALESLLDCIRSRGLRATPLLIDLLLRARDVLADLVTAARTGGPAPTEKNAMRAELERALEAANAHQSGLSAPPAEQPPRASTIFAISFTPDADLFRRGMDPLLLLRELAGLGTLLKVRPDLSALPLLSDLDPASCYLSWAILLRTEQPRSAIESVFEFVRDCCRLSIEVHSEPVASEEEHLEASPKAPEQQAIPDARPNEEWSPSNPEMLCGFCPEADEHLEAVDRHLLTLDSNPTCKETLNAVYRAFHSIKGVASMFDLEALVSLAHEAENLLNCAREGTVDLRGGLLDLAFASADGLKRQVGYVRAWLAAGIGGLEADPELPVLLGRLRAALPGGESPDKPRGSVVLKPTPSSNQGVRPPVGAPGQVEPRLAAQTEKETVRVDRGRLDKLINSIGELVIAQSMVQQEVDEQARSGFHSRALPELCKIARDLQELSLSLRMVPLQSTFQKISRVVRDLSKKIAKPVHFQVTGEETELDKTVVDRLGDPLVHMVRNALDHGIESPNVRLAVGKPAEGTVTLRAFHQGGNVHIELTDDGKGLDRRAILAKAIERDLVQEGQNLTDAEVFGLIFEPGFSTAKVVTDVSGRGVGMDVVRRNVEALQGSIQIRSQHGKGTTFTIRLPLTLAILDGLSVSLRDEVYILPLLSVIESFQPRGADVHTVAGRGEVVVVRGEAVPLLRLYRLLGRPARVTDPRKGLVVLVENQGQKYALLVDELLGQLQVVMKSLDVNFQKVEGIAGATILGDGRVAMILDVYGLTRLAQMTARGRAGDSIIAAGRT